MKTVFMVSGGRSRIFLVPENDFEKTMIKTIGDDQRASLMRIGDSTEYRDGWTAQYTDEDSLMIVLDD